MASATQNINSNRCKILIIGAGMAGLSAASHLVKNGVTDFKILEARNRIGGRIVSISTGRHNLTCIFRWLLFYWKYMLQNTFCNIDTIIRLM